MRENGEQLVVMAYSHTRDLHIHDRARWNLAMKFWKFVKDKAVIDRLQDEAIHVAAMEEVRSGRRRDGLWTKAIIEANGDDARAKIAYLRLLVTAIRDDLYLAGRSDELFAAAQPAASRRGAPPASPDLAGTSPPPDAPEEDLMRYYGIWRENGQYAFGTYRFFELKHALAHARHMRELQKRT